MGSLAALMPETLTVPPGYAEALASIQSGQPFTCILLEDADQRAATLDAVIDAVTDLKTRFVRTGNPLRSPLTLERLIIQAVGPEVDLRIEREPDTVTQLLAGPVGDESRVILVVEQAETLDPEAVQVFKLMAPGFQDTAPSLQVVFAGAPSFAAMLAAGPAPVTIPAAARIVPHAPVVAPAVVRPASPAIIQEVAREAPRAERASAPAVIVEREPARRRSVLPGLVLLLLLLAAGGLAFTWLAYPGALRPFLPSSSVLRAATPAAMPAPAPAPAATPTPIPAPDTEAAARLRRDFDAFLAASGRNAARLSESQRDALLQEFLAWRRNQASPGR